MNAPDTDSVLALREHSEAIPSIGFLETSKATEPKIFRHCSDVNYLVVLILTKGVSLVPHETGEAGHRTFVATIGTKTTSQYSIR